MKRNFFKKATILTILTLISACGGSGGGSSKVILDLEMPTALDALSVDAVRVSGSVWSVGDDGETPDKEILAEEDANLTIRGHYALPISGLKSDQTYQFNLKIYYQANAFPVTDGSQLLATKTTSQKTSDEDRATRTEYQTTSGDDREPSDEEVLINTTISNCPNLSLTPDTSLIDGQWLLLCEVSYVTLFQKGEYVVIPEESIICTELDADGDGLANLDEIDFSVNPFEGDFDGDCVADGVDAFPKDPSESKDTDGDGIGDNADTDRDGDGLFNDNEETLGTDPLDSDSDDDGVVDGSDNCPLASNSNQDDTDSDGEGDVCDNDADNDGLSNADEANAGTDPLNPDTDGDGAQDGWEVDQQTDPLDSDTDDDGSVDGEDDLPLDPTEQVDTDGDGVGNNADLCDEVADPFNSNIDGDAEGDVCDDDMDNDGVLNALEDGVDGLDPQSRDSDGDGLIDNWGTIQPATLLEGEEADRCPTVSKTADNQVDHDSDGDGDQFGVLCDLSDSAELDPSANRIHFDAIFVDGTNGDDSNDGSRASPLKTLVTGGQAAQEVSKDVYVLDGEYIFDESFMLPAGVQLYGGFNNDFATRDATGTILKTTSSSLLIDAIYSSESSRTQVGLDGFTLESNVPGFESPILLATYNADINLTNNEIRVTSILHATAIVAEESNVALNLNTIILDGSNVGTAIELDQVTGSLVNNTIQLQNFNGRKTAIKCLNIGESPVELQGNQIDLWEGEAASDSNAVYVHDCSLDANATHYEVPLVGDFNFEGFSDGGGNVLDGLF